jgi:deoxyadenosine/deoxycytidine kinase
MLISIEGNIGSGKRLLVSILRNYFDENVFIFNCNSDLTILKKFYNKPSRWSFALEVDMTDKKYKKIKRNLSKILITKGSPETDNECFINTFKDLGYITENELKIYNNLFSGKKSHYDSHIYIRSNVNKCYENIITNSSSKNVNFKYITMLHDKYEEWSKKLNDKSLILDAEEFRDIDGNQMVQEKFINIILTFYPQLKEFLKEREEPNKWKVVLSKKNKKK